jgi:hypothetical protein
MHGGLNQEALTSTTGSVVPLASIWVHPHIRRMTHLELNDVQAEALARELSHLIENDRYPLSPRIVALKEILGQLRPSRTRAPAPATELRAAEQGAVRTAMTAMTAIT